MFTHDSSLVVSTERATTCGSDGGDVQRLSCDDGVISVQTALYGQGYGVNCIEGRPLGVLSLRQCSQAGTVDVLKKRCDGMPECELNINVFHTSDPCYGIYTHHIHLHPFNSPCYL
ncbi:hypothetical protein PFLUV_G00061360 [Perca fluviatilis]|uniref:SUEL-type lectin domain-containing protein n=1 Tax=Perca fluviatilis TaxID=8168 RepID=A0A6A5EN36_PERFL|nr:hypothetical protein PFLUV_G00061360 [Perca fluviatilis]